MKSLRSMDTSPEGAALVGDDSHITSAAPTMWEVVHDKYGCCDEVLGLHRLNKPAPGRGEVLVRVHAAGVSIGDWLVIAGLPYVARLGFGITGPKVTTPGFEISGTVEAIGEGAEEFQPGDEVFASCKGGLAEYVVASEAQLVLKPATLSFEQAAVVPISGVAALQALRDAGEVAPGSRTMVIGASGGVGTYAVQIAKAFDAEVTGVCGSESVEMVRAIGADHIIDYTRENVTDTTDRFDLIVDMVGKNRLADLRQLLSPRGTLVMVGGSGGRWTMGIGRTLRGVLWSPFVSQRLRPFLSKPRKKDLPHMNELLVSGKVTPVIDKVFPLRAISQALDYLGARSTRGKTVITVRPMEGAA